MPEADIEGALWLESRIVMQVQKGEVNSRPSASGPFLTHRLSMASLAGPHD
jgi:hypothetical protein